MLAFQSPSYHQSDRLPLCFTLLFISEQLLIFRFGETQVTCNDTEQMDSDGTDIWSIWGMWHEGGSVEHAELTDEFSLLFILFHNIPSPLNSSIDKLLHVNS